jgi:Rps23 Pro-64 3,4-dihydroxylase Tpa1-like proline 4-hydroxylase
MKNYTHWSFDQMMGYAKEVRGAQFKKFFTPDGIDTLEYIESDMPVVWKTIQYFNSQIFINYLEQLTGISNIIPDPTLNGGGCHYIKNGGRLALHTDYGKHPDTNLHRRINLLLYLTPEWSDEWNGHLELWKKEPWSHYKSILPVFNRAVIFNTTNDSIHGHPVPLNVPNDVGRYSIAMYYFTEYRPMEEQSNATSAIFYE